MYYFYLGQMELPIAPAELKTQIKNKNKVVSLVNGGDVNVLRDAGLTEFAFDVLLPNSRYPFAKYARKADHYLSRIKKMKQEKKPFQFVVCRMKENGELLSFTNTRVTLEDYQISESADEGFDFVVKVKLKQYREFSTKTINIQEGENGEKIGEIQEPRPSDREIPKQMVGGETLWQTLRKATGSGDNWAKIAEINKIAVPTALRVGMMIKHE